MLKQANKRVDARLRVLKEGKLLVNPPSGTLDVRIRDLSNSGARVELSAPCELPSDTALIVVQAGTIQQCVVAWQRGAFAGLQFVEAPRKLGIRRY